ncbi:hypothetical protein Droror1_Dr00021627 [Drosera rotundifolia]
MREQQYRPFCRPFCTIHFPFHFRTKIDLEMAVSISLFSPFLSPFHNFLFLGSGDLGGFVGEEAEEELGGGGDEDEGFGGEFGDLGVEFHDLLGSVEQGFGVVMNLMMGFWWGGWVLGSLAIIGEMMGLS